MEEEGVAEILTMVTLQAEAEAALSEADTPAEAVPEAVGKKFSTF